MKLRANPLVRWSSIMSNPFSKLSTYLDKKWQARPKVKGSKLHSFAYEQVLGTTLELSVWAEKAAAEAACKIVLSEIDRLSAIFNRFDSHSELNAWLASENERLVSADLLYLLQESQSWVEQTRGAFHPAVDELSRYWQEAQANNELPDAERITQALQYFGQASYSLNIKKSTAKKLIPLGLNFNAIAKGHIVDSAARLAAWKTNSDSLLLNIGGDVRHMGSADVKVGLEDAFSKTDSQATALTLKLNNQAVACSGNSRRGYQIARKWYSHIIDPRTAWPVSQTINVTVIAPECSTADVLATAFSVLTPQESLELADSLKNVGCRLVSQEGQVWINDYFKLQIC